MKKIKNDEDSKVFLKFILYFNILSYWKNFESINIKYITPIGWTKKEVFIQLKSDLEGFYSLFEIDWYQDNNLNIEEFFEKDIFLNILDLESLDIYLKRNEEWGIEQFLKIIEDEYYDFLDTIVNSYYYFWEFRIHKDIIYNKIENLYNLNWEKFEIIDKYFQGKDKVFFIKAIISFYYLWFIDILDFYMEKDNIWNIYYVFWITIKGKLKEIIENISEIKISILNKVFDQEYKQITIKKKNWKLNMLEWDLEFDWTDIKFIDLKNKYPHSKIEADNYNWNISKYKVKEKIKLDNVE